MHRHGKATEAPPKGWRRVWKNEMSNVKLRPQLPRNCLELRPQLPRFLSRSAVAGWRAKAVPRPAHSAALVTALQIFRRATRSTTIMSKNRIPLFTRNA